MQNQIIQPLVANLAVWVSAVSALISAVSALVAIIFSRISCRAELGVSKADRNFHVLPSECTQNLIFTLKNYGKEKVDIIKIQFNKCDISSNQIHLIYTDDGGYPYYQEDDSLVMHHHEKVCPPYPSGVDVSDPNSSANWAFYRASFPLYVVVITMKYKRKGKFFLERVTEHLFYEVKGESVTPIAPGKYPFLKKHFK